MTKKLLYFSESMDFWEGVGVSCLLAIAVAFLEVRDDLTLVVQQLVWLAFVVACGLVLRLPSPLTAGRLLRMALPCCVTLFVVLSFENILQIIWRAAYLRILSWPPVPSAEAISFVNYGLWYLFLMAATVPAVVTATFARNRVSAGLKFLWGLDPAKLGRFEKVVNTLIRIATVLGAGLVVHR